MVDVPPRIGLTTYREPAAWGVWNEPADLLPTTYADAVAGAGGLPMLLPPVAGGDESLRAAAALQGVHGLMLSGGADVDPRRYGAARDESTGPARPDRDAWEIALIRHALWLDLPVLGICRGMQVMAVALGGTLTQHLPDAVGNASHQPTVGKHGRHEVMLEDGCRLNNILGSVANVATYHHQAVASLPDSVVATGWSEDETIEAVEVRGKTWAVGVQWHPEVSESAKLFKAFIAAATKWRAAHLDRPEPLKVDTRHEGLSR